MPTPLFDITPLIPFIETGATILTPNNRLANKIQQAWGIYLQQQGASSWRIPNIYAIESWCENLWHQLQDCAWPGADATAVDAFQELLLWEQVIQQDNDKPALLNPGGLATTAQRAWQLLQQWQLSAGDLLASNDSGARLLQRWGAAFEKKLGEIDGITRPQQIDQLRKALANGAIPRNKLVVLVGFQTRIPLYDALLEAAFERCQELATSEYSASCCWQFAARDNQQELECAALWAKQILAESPECRIGIIVPDLAMRRDVIERVFREHLEPDYQLPHCERTTAPFNISTAIPLSDTPLINAALQLLQLNCRSLPLDKFCQLLQSPFWGKVENELVSRASAENGLRALAKAELRTLEFREVCARAEDEDNPISHRLEQLESLRRQAPARASYRQWRQFFERQLTALGWPGSRSIDSVEYQQREHWLRLLEQFDALDTLGPAAKISKVSLDSALYNLQRLSQNTLFQAESEDSSLQILGLLEGAGLRFTHLWMTGMDDRQWPPPPSPNPLLPISLQRQYNMPRAAADRELELSRDLLAAYRSAADQIVFSHSQFDGDSELAPSTLISDVSFESIEGLLGNTDFRKIPDIQAGLRPRLEKVELSSGPTLQIEQFEASGSIRGGSAILKDQAACPFNAFARWRLGAQQAMEPGIGLTPLDRGIILHDCLDQLWGELKDSATLASLDVQATQTLVGNIAEKNLAPWKARKPESGERYFQLEKERLASLLQAWLDVERQRPPFQVVARESLLEGDFAGLPLSLRIDRIDQTSDGKTILIDYKTGQASINDWLGERPSEPQLPLYALMQQPHPCGASFAVINIDQQQFVGTAEDPAVLPLTLSAHSRAELLPWGKLLEQWQSALTALATEYRCGYAALEIHNNSSFALQAELLPLNRWPERQQIERYLHDLPVEQAQ